MTWILLCSYYLASEDFEWGCVSLSNVYLHMHDMLAWTLIISGIQ